MSDAADVDRPFEEPWQAQAFAIVVALNERGLLPWPAWTRYLGDSLAREAGAAAVDGPTAVDGPVVRGEDESRAPAASAYYRAWLDALERFARDAGLVAPLALGARREAIRAYGRVARESAVLRIASAQSPTSDGPR